MASLISDLRLNRATGETSPYYRIAWRESGRQAKLALGFVTLPQAEAAFRQWERLRNAGLSTEPRKPSPSSSPPAPRVPTMREWWGPVVADEAWPDSPVQRALTATGYSDGTRDQADAARRWIVRELGELRLDQVTAGAADKLVVALKAAGRRSRTCQIYVRWLARSLQFAVDEKLLAAVPSLRRPRNVDAKVHRWLTPEQTAMLYEVLDQRVAAGDCDRASALAIRMQETLTMRPGEVRHRRWEDLRSDRKWLKAEIHIGPIELVDETWRPKASGRGSSARTVGVPPLLLARLRDHWLRSGQPASGWIFPGVEGRPLGNFKKSLASACEAANVPIMHPHALRHTGATRIALSGVERRTLMAIGGWSTSETLDEVYSHTTDARVTTVLTDAEVGRLPVPSSVPSEQVLEEGS